MKRINSFIFTLTILATLSATALADKHIEAGAYLTTTTVLDDAFEFFSSDYLVMDHWGLDLRVEVAEIKDTLHLLPFISYRYSTSAGEPMLAGGYMDTTLDTHDVDAGLRGRVWFLPWLGAYTQIYTGFTRIHMEGELPGATQGMHALYTDHANKWNLGAGLGIEVRISPWRLERHNVRRFNFGGEIGVGFVKRMQTKFDPKLEGGDNLSLTNVETTNFGDIDLSGVVFQMGLTFSFL